MQKPGEAVTSPARTACQEAIINTIPLTAKEYRLWWTENTDIPYGLCWCGCGEETSIAHVTWPDRGHVKGEPKRYAGHGHHTRKAAVEYVIEDRGYKTPCWVWQRAKIPKGYGYVRIKGTNYLAHRLYYEREKGPIPEGLQLDHKCRIKSCVNVEHLEPVTHVENLRRGNSTKLTFTKARRIRLLYATGLYTCLTLAKQFGVGKTAVRNIINGTSWKE